MFIGMSLLFNTKTIENSDALEVISTYDNDKAFHFVDPKYSNTIIDI